MEDRQETTRKRQVIVVGGGAAGLMAAIRAAEQGAAVTLLEHNDKPGRKIGITGIGKCNLTNLRAPKDAYRGSHPEFAASALEQFPVKETLLFFDGIGLTYSEKNALVYPRSRQAKCIPELLERQARTLKVKIKTQEHVEELSCQEGVWKVKTSGWTYEGDAVILANGSKASEAAGADGSGYVLAEKLGHHVIKPLPALLGLKCRDSGFAGWSGVRTDGKLTLLIDGKPEGEIEGELQLTEYGISGIPVFQISRFAVRALDEGKKVRLSVNFLPEYPKAYVGEWMEQRRERFPWKTSQDLLLGMFPDRLVKVLVKQKDLIKAIMDFELEVTGSTGFASAQVCSGGVDTEEVNPVTMESRIHKGLYFAGELLDIDGACGGYNLQWAWSSGAAAGVHAAGGEE